MKFQLASVTVKLTIHNHVPKPAVTPPEVAILRMMHVGTLGDNPIDDSSVKISKREYETNPQTEIMRLLAKYGNNPATKKPWIDELYPGVRQNPALLPTKFEQVKWLPAHVTASGTAPSRIQLPGEPGYEEPKTDGEVEGRAAQWEPPVSRSVELDAPEGVAPGDALKTLAKDAVDEMAETTN